MSQIKFRLLNLLSDYDFEIFLMKCNEIFFIRKNETKYVNTQSKCYSRKVGTTFEKERLTETTEKQGMTFNGLFMFIICYLLVISSIPFVDFLFKFQK